VVTTELNLSLPFSRNVILEISTVIQLQMLVELTVNFLDVETVSLTLERNVTPLITQHAEDADCQLAVMVLLMTVRSVMTGTTSLETAAPEIAH